MTDIKKLLKFDLKFLKGYYKSYIFIALFMLFVFGNMVFNMGALILAFYYSLDTDENYKKVNSLVQTLPINNKEYISYKYISSFMQLILILIMFLIATILILI